MVHRDRFNIKQYGGGLYYNTSALKIEIVPIVYIFTNKQFTNKHFLSVR